MSDGENDKRLEDHERRIRELEQAPPYFITIGGCWALLWAALGAWCYRWLGG